MVSLRRQSGFTVIELLLAMTFFSFILIFMTSGFIFVNRQYTKGIVVREVHSNARLVIEDLARSIRHSKVTRASLTVCGDDMCLPSGERILCLDNGQTYYWQEPTPAEAAAGVNTRLWRGEGCEGGFASRQEMLPEQVSVWDIDVIELSPGTYRLRVALVATNERLRLPEGAEMPECAEVSGPGSQYCDVVVLQSVVTSRK